MSKKRGERNFDTLTPLRSQPQKKRRITANILTFGRDKRCGKRGFGSRTVFSIQLFVETKLFTFASRLNSRKSLRNFESEEEPCRRRLKRASQLNCINFHSARDRTHLRSSSNNGFLLLVKKNARGIILHEKN